ncbi:MAG: dienelactone hydrolase family protein [Bacteroidales bacterium]|nr:dienelactone hydrolase family protein [Bacteroidales bacterium]MDP3001831.1 dienelactone hydrolase family protein [Bacteroidales bacterium]
MDKKITTLYDDYSQRRTNRRDFFRKLVMLSGSTAAALALLPILEENKLKASANLQDDPDLLTEFIKYPGETGDVRGFLAWPKAGKKFPAVIVIHENRGLVPHIRDVTRRMAKEGFLTLAPDALSPLGGTPEDISNVGAMFKQLNGEQTTKNFVAAVKYLKTHPLSTGKVGCTGFCWGGAMTNQVAVNSPDLNAAVPYYGRQPSAEQVAMIKAPIMAHYGGDDAGINQGIPAFEEALKKNKKEYQIFIYEGAQHAFNNDSNPERYNEQAAKLAWGRTIAFFKEKLK